MAPRRAAGMPSVTSAEPAADAVEELRHTGEKVLGSIPAASVNEDGEADVNEGPGRCPVPLRVPGCHPWQASGRERHPQCPLRGLELPRQAPCPLPSAFVHCDAI